VKSVDTLRNTKGEGIQLAHSWPW